MAFIDGTVVNVALPFLQTNLNATAIGIQWVVEAYSLFLSALLLVGGSLGDRYGRRRIVMSAVGEEQAGVASGINNAVSRTAGLLAIAVFGVVMLQAFSKTLARRMNEIQLDDQLRHSVYEQRVKLAGVELPPVADPLTQEKIKGAVADSSVSGFRIVMIISAALALSSGGSSWLFFRNSRLAKSKKQRN